MRPDKAVHTQPQISNPGVSHLHEKSKIITTSKLKSPHDIDIVTSIEIRGYIVVLNSHMLEIVMQ